GIRDPLVTGVQTCALPISSTGPSGAGDYVAPLRYSRCTAASAGALLTPGDSSFQPELPAHGTARRIHLASGGLHEPANSAGVRRSSCGIVARRAPDHACRAVQALRPLPVDAVTATSCAISATAPDPLSLQQPSASGSEVGHRRRTARPAAASARGARQRRGARIADSPAENRPQHAL